MGVASLEGQVGKGWIADTAVRRIGVLGLLHLRLNVSKLG
jgi:hypothetical protein